MRNKKRRMLQRLRQMAEVVPAPAEPAKPPAKTYDEPAEEVAAKAPIKSRKRKSVNPPSISQEITRNPVFDAVF